MFIQLIKRVVAIAPFRASGRECGGDVCTI